MTQNTAQIIDLNSFRKERSEKQDAETLFQHPIPVLMWVPVWVMVPQHPLHSM